MVEWDGLENRCTLYGYRGFESHPLRASAAGSKDASAPVQDPVTGSIRQACRGFVASLLIVFTANAQPFYGVTYRPPGIKYDVQSTEHFDVIYQRGFDTLAARVGQQAERAFSEAIDRAGLTEPFRMPIILNAYNDASNGFVSPFPFRMEIDASPIKGKILNPRHEDWLAQVIPHELAHAAQAEIKGGFGVGGIIRLMSPDWARALNLGVPRGITEGFAVSYESRGSDVLGRLNFSFSQMQMRAAGRASPWTLSQVLDPPAYTRPFNRHYLGGGMLHNYLADSVRSDFMVNAARFYNRWPFLGFGVALWQSTGQPPWKLSRRLVENVGRDAREIPSESAWASQTTVLTDEAGLACRRPAWINNETIVAFCSGYHSAPGFYRIDATTGHRVLMSRQAITEDYLLTVNPGQDELLFAQYRPAAVGTTALHSFLKRIDLSRARVHPIVDSDRLYAPVRLSDGTLLALNDAGPFSNLVRVQPDGKRELLFSEPGTRILEVKETVDADLVLLLNSSGEQALYTASLGSDGLDSLRPALSAVRGSIYDPAVSPGGQRLLFVADPDGVPNVFALDVSTGTVDRLTRAAFGAYEPSVSPDGRRMAFVNHTADQDQIAVQPLTVGETLATPPFAIRPVLYRHLPERHAVADIRPYRPFPAFLRPRAAVPYINVAEAKISAADRRLGPGIGVSIFGADVLRQWAYSVTGFIQEKRPWGQLNLQTGRHLLQPYITISDRPKSGVGLVGGEVARIAYEERAISVGAVVPARLSMNAENTTVVAGMSAEYRSLRFLDSEANPVTAFDNRLTLNPVASFSYRLQANLRDIVPRSGFRVVSRAELDVRTEDVVIPARAWRTDASVYLPTRVKASTGMRLLAGVLWQNRGSVLETETFLPRGYDEGDFYLADGTFLKAGVEAIQPIAWIDRGIVLIPISLQAIYLYGFAETIGRSTSWRETRSSVGAGLGVRLLAVHHLGFDVRVGVARLLEEEKWTVTLR